MQEAGDVKLNQGPRVTTLTSNDPVNENKLSDLTVLTLNSRGLNEAIKLRALLNKGYQIYNDTPTAIIMLIDSDKVLTT